MAKARTAPKFSLYNKLLISIKEIDRGLLFLVFGFLLFGLIIIYDSTAVLSQDIYGFAYRFVLLQLAWILIGLVGFFMFASIELSVLKRYATKLFVVTIAILTLLAVFGVLPCDLNFIMTPCINGANRWFYVNPPPFPSLPLVGILGFQPSELSKFVLIIFLAALLEKTIKSKSSEYAAFKNYIVVTGLVAFLIFLQPNLSTAGLLFLIGTAMYFTTNESIKPLLFSIPIFVSTFFVFMISSSYRRDRLLTFLSIRDSSSALETGYHIRQIQIALGSGGLFGLGFGQSRQKFLYLPEVFADSIFAIIGEELGFIGTGFLVLAFCFFIYKGYSISKRTDDLFARLLSIGVTTWVALQFFVNVAAMLRLIPLTGIPLPLISYGGSSLIFILSGLGLLANVSRSVSKR